MTRHAELLQVPI